MKYSPDKNSTLTTNFTPDPNDAGIKRYWSKVRSIEIKRIRQAIKNKSE